MNERSELSQYMQALTASTIRTDTGHLAQAELLAHLRTQLPPDRQAEVQNHLLDCAQCLADFRDLHDFFAPVQEDETELSEFETKRMWRALQPRLAESAPMVVPARSRWRLPLAAAAGLLVALVPLGLLSYQLKTANQQLAAQNERAQQEKRELADQLAQRQTQTDTQLTQVQSLEQQLAQLRQPAVPQVLTPYDLLPQSLQQRSGDSQKALPPITFAQPRETALLNLTLENGDPGKAYDLELFDANNKSLWKQPAVKLNPNNGFVVSLSSDFLPSGKYRLKVFQRGAPSKQPHADYVFSVKAPVPTTKP